MSDKPTVLPWHRAAAEQIMDFDDDNCPGDAAECAYVIAAYDPHDADMASLNADFEKCCCQNEEALRKIRDLQADIECLTAERDEARHLFESTDLHRGRLFAENNRLKQALEHYADTATWVWVEAGFGAGFYRYVGGKGAWDHARDALEGKWK